MWTYLADSLTAIGQFLNSANSMIAVSTVIGAAIAIRYGGRLLIRFVGAIVRWM